MPFRPRHVYIHVPFCARRCSYCDFAIAVRRVVPVDAYLDALRAELNGRFEAPGGDWPVATLYFGGGTPSKLGAAGVSRLMALLGEFVTLERGAEVTLETNPEDVTAEAAAAWREAGINRLSLGAQSFDAAHLRTLGRDHAPEETQAAVAAARSAGFANVSLDLIFAVPGQTLADWEADVAAATALAPEHVSAYALTWEPGTPFHAWRASGRVAAVGDEDEAAMAAHVTGALEAAGLARYEISSFARPGFESRHNQRYWDGSDYLGLGAGAHSFSRDPFPGRRWANERLPDRHRDAVRARGTAVASEERLTVPQARGEHCFTGLRRTAGVDLAAFERRFGVALAAAFPHLPRLVADGLVEEAGGRLRLTARGFAFADSVAATFV